MHHCPRTTTTTTTILTEVVEAAEEEEVVATEMEKMKEEEEENLKHRRLFQRLFISVDTFALLLLFEAAHCCLLLMEFTISASLTRVQLLAAWTDALAFGVLLDETQRLFLYLKGQARTCTIDLSLRLCSATSSHQ